MLCRLLHVNIDKPTSGCTFLPVSPLECGCMHAVAAGSSEYGGFELVFPF